MNIIALINLTDSRYTVKTSCLLNNNKCIDLTSVRNGWRLPCSSPPEPNYFPEYIESHRPNYNYKYKINVRNPPNCDSFRKSDHMFMDPRTGMMYHPDTIKRSVVAEERDADVYEQSTLVTQPHIYDTPYVDTSTIPYTKDAEEDVSNSTESLECRTESV